MSRKADIVCFGSGLAISTVEARKFFQTPTLNLTV
jgi:hypothetical protein